MLALLRSVQWMRVIFYSLALSAMALNVIGGIMAREMVSHRTVQAKIDDTAPAPLQPEEVVAKSGISATTLAAPHKLAVPAPHPEAHKESISQKLSRSGYTLAAERLSKLDELKAKHNPVLLHSKSNNAQVAKHTSMKTSEPFSCTAENPVHVVFASDPQEYLAMVTSMNSAIHNSQHPERLRFALIFPADVDPGGLCGLIMGYIQRFPGIQCQGESGGILSAQHSCTHRENVEGATKESCFCSTVQFHLVPFDSQEYDVLKYTTSNSLDRKELLMGVNFARNFLDDLLLPWGVGRAVYLDVDTVVQGDLVKLGDTEFKPGKFFAAVSSCYLHMTFWFDFNVDVVKRTMSKNDCYVNAGVYVVDLQQYKANQMQQRIEQLIKAHKQKKIWKLGVHQSSFILALFNHTQLLDARWNVVQLGWNRALPKEKLDGGWVLHWNGSLKPWKKEGLYKERWKPYSTT